MEGSTVQVNCSNLNVQPFHGRTFWVDSMNMTVGKGGVLEFNANRSQAGVYTCGVELFDQTITVKVPTRSFNLVVHCKL